MSLGYLRLGNPALESVYRAAVEKLKGGAYSCEGLCKADLYMLGLAEADDYVKALMSPTPINLNIRLTDPCDAYEAARVLLLNMPRQQALSSLTSLRREALIKCGELDRLALRIMPRGEALRLLGKYYVDAVNGRLGIDSIIKLSYALASYGLYGMAIGLVERFRDELTNANPVNLVKLVLNGILGIVPWGRGILAGVSHLEHLRWVIAIVKYRDEPCLIVQFKSMGMPNTVSNCRTQVEGARLHLRGLSIGIGDRPIKATLKGRGVFFEFMVNNTEGPIVHRVGGKGCVIRGMDFELHECQDITIAPGDYVSIYGHY